MIGVMSTVYLLYNLLGNAYEKVSLKNAELVKLKNDIEAKKNLLKRYQTRLIKFSREESQNRVQKDLFASICKTVSDVLLVERVR